MPKARSIIIFFSLLVSSLHSSAQPIPLIYHPVYNVSFGRLADALVKLLHPIDGLRYKRIYDYLEVHCSSYFTLCEPSDPVDLDQLQHVHSLNYLQSLRRSKTISQIIDLDTVLAWFPAQSLYKHVIVPQQWATAGTLLATDCALKQGIAINIGGGFHHAKAHCGEGGCALADIPLAIVEARKKRPDLNVVVIDLDAHQGNGNAALLGDDPHTFIFDMHNPHVAPYDEELESNIDYPVQLNGGHLSSEWAGITWPDFLVEYPTERRVDDQEYIRLLSYHLPRALEEAYTKLGGVDLIIYNAGSDIHVDDPWGCLAVSTTGVIERDKCVVTLAQEHNIPLVMVLSGGYGTSNHSVVSKSLEQLLRTFS